MHYSHTTLPTTPTDQIPFIHQWSGEGKPRGVLVIAHGMGEHALRYAPLAQALVDAGFVVWANDHRGHGKTVQSQSQLGDYGQAGWAGLVDDQLAVIALARKTYPNLPVLLMGHSMGSFVVQHVLTKASDQIDGAALSGSTAVDVMAQFASDPSVDTFALMNEAFAPTRTDFDWLSRDAAEVDKYVADPLCGFTVTDASSADLMAAGVAFSAPEATAKIRKDLPLYIFSGDKDPVGLNGELVTLLANRYREAGVSDVALTLYPEGRHEVFNETNRAEVVADFVNWAEQQLPEAK
ncbi:MAG: alpha-beta hydrolase superfamily lysophospholipase [Parvibaculaceae bacterium]|jgi:alpha-beta hydrolase superfamily lysophospholipase